MIKADSYKPLIIDILAKSFVDNKSVNHVVKQDIKKEKRIRELMRYSFEIFLAFGEVWISDNKRACALILFPDKKRTTLKAIGWDIRLALSAIGLFRVLDVIKREAAIKKHYPKEPFSYLWFVGVLPDHQKQGIGSVFLKEILQQCQEKGRAVYLETSTLRNLPWHQKNGFEIYQELDFGYRLFMLHTS